MARAIVLNHAGVDSRFDFKKLERKALYGSRRRVTLADAHADRAGGAPAQGEFETVLLDPQRFAPRDQVGERSIGRLVAQGVERAPRSMT